MVESRLSCHVEGVGDPRHQRADMPQPQQPEGLALQPDTDGSSPPAFSRQPVFQRNLPRNAQNQAPRQLGGAFACSVGAADRYAQVGGGLNVEGGVAPPGGNQQAQVGQPLQQRAGKWRAFPHSHHHVETGQAFREGVFAGQVIAEEGDFGSRRQL